MKNLTLSSLLVIASLFLNSCSSNSSGLETYTDNPMERARVESPVQVNFDIYLKNADGSAVKNTVVTLKSSTFIDSGTTNNEGFITLIGERSGSEPLQFSFENEKLHATELLGHLPNSLSQGVLSFEVMTASRVRLSHYLVEGLHR